jgi:hypothetical protein
MFPVGHPMGPFHPGVGQPRQHHSLRIGKLAITMGDEPFAVWAAAHRPPDRAEPWTRDLVAAVTASVRCHPSFCCNWLGAWTSSARPRSPGCPPSRSTC